MTAPREEQQPSQAEFPVTRLDRVFAGPLFFLTIFWMGTAGLAVHLLADAGNKYLELSFVFLAITVVLLPIFILEAIAHWLAGSRCLKQNLWVCLFPPLRLVARDHHDGTHLWLPGFGWRPANHQLQEELERRLSYPMIGIALLILPLLAIEHFYAEPIENDPRLGLLVQIAAALIWLAFAAEFLVGISLVRKRVSYVKEHWLDVVIICLPLIAFARVLRIARVARLSKIGKTARVFRLRGLAMRAWRAVLLLEIVDRLVHRDPEKRLRMVNEQIREKEEELAQLRAEATLLTRKIEEAAAKSQSETDNTLAEPTAVNLRS